MASKNQQKKENDFYIIYSFEHNAYWKRNSFGYSRHLNQAGVYGYTEAKEICTKANMMEYATKIGGGVNNVSINECMIPIPEELVSYLRSQPSSLV